MYISFLARALLLWPSISLTGTGCFQPVQAIGGLFASWGKSRGPGHGLAGELRALLAAVSVFAAGGEEAKNAGLAWEKRLDLLDRVLQLQRQLMGGVRGGRPGATVTVLQVGGSESSGVREIACLCLLLLVFAGLVQ